MNRITSHDSIKIKKYYYSSNYSGVNPVSLSIIYSSISLISFLSTTSPPDKGKMTGKVSLNGSKVLISTCLKGVKALKYKV